MFVSTISRCLNRTQYCLNSIHLNFHACGCQKSLVIQRDYELPDEPIYKAKLEKKHHIYRVIGCKRGPPELEIILTKDSLEHGVAGEVLTVEKHVGRTLIRKFEAVYASPENIRDIASSFAHKLVVPQEALKLPDYPIKSTIMESWGTHTIGITVNKVDSVEIKMKIAPWMKDSKKR